MIGEVGRGEPDPDVHLKVSIVKFPFLIPPQISKGESIIPPVRPLQT